MWKAPYALGIAEHVILWNALQMHPHLEDQPLSNRTPTSAEFVAGRAAVRALLEAFPNAVVVAVGRHAGVLLREVTCRTVHDVRHPARGGATLFAEGLRKLVDI